MLTSRQVDATKGPLIPSILRYAIPLILSTIIQSLFNAVDLAVLGNMASPTAVASVGATVNISSLLVTFFVGISGGVTILLARYIGADSEEKTRTTVSTAVISSVAFGMMITVLGLFFSPLFLDLTHCPADCYEGALLYIRIYVCGAPAITLYNFSSAILTSSGDTKRPLYYMMISGLLNLVLNVLLCLLLPNKIVAVAIATVTTQLLGAILCVRRLCTMDGLCRLELRKLTWDIRYFGRILRMGAPLALANILYPIAGLQIQTALNSFGSAAIAGSSAASTLNQFPGALNSSFSTATGVFMGQNLGAEQHDRVKRSLLHTLWMLTALCVAICVLFCLSSDLLFSLLLGAESTDAIAAAKLHQLTTTLFYVLPGIASILGSAIQCFGYPTVSSVTSITCVLGVRVVWTLWVFPKMPTLLCLFACYPVSWIFQIAANTLFFLFFYRRYKKGKYKRL